MILLALYDVVPRDRAASLLYDIGSARVTSVCVLCCFVARKEEGLRRKAHKTGFSEIKVARQTNTKK